MQAASTVHRYSFGDFTLDVDRGALLRGDDEMQLRRQSYDVLLHLVRHAGSLVTKDQLLEAIWGNTAVTDGSITHCLMEIRAALGDDDHTIIRTVVRRGYIFELPVNELTATEQGSAAAPHYSRAIIALGIIAAIGAMFLLLNEDAPAKRDSIAIMMFENRGGAAEDVPFVDSMHDQIMHELDRATDLRLISHLSVAHFRDKPFDLGDIRSSLGADYVMTGSVHRVENAVRLNLKLYNAAKDELLWSDSIDRELTVNNLLGMQREVATSIALQLDSTFDPADYVPAATNTPGNLEAFNLYHDGQFYLRQIEDGLLDPEGVYEAAIARFEAARDADPNWASPYAGLARVYHFGMEYTGLSPEEAADASRENLAKALELDPDHPLALDSLAYIRYSWDKDFDAARATYARLRSMGVEPNWGNGIMEWQLGDYDAAIPLFRQAVVDDPLSYRIRLQLANILACSERYEEAIAEFSRIIAMRPFFNYLKYYVAVLNLRLGNVDEAHTLYEESLADFDDESHAALYLALDGQLERAAAALDLQGPYSKFRFDETAAAAILIGDTGRAIEALEEAVAEGNFQLRHLRCTEEVEQLEGHPRFEEILRTAGVSM